MQITIRQATPDDAEAILEIYGHYVENTAISFEYVTPTVEEFRGRIENTLKKYPYIVAEREGKIVGYAYAGPFRTRIAYDHSCEVTIYIDKNRVHGGVGRLLYEVLEETLLKMGFENCYASIAVPRGEDQYVDNNSRDFHAHMGYIEVGFFTSCGKKFGKYYDMIYMEKRLVDN